MKSALLIYKQALKIYKVAGLLLVFHTSATREKSDFICARSEARCHLLLHHHPAAMHRHSAILPGTVKKEERDWRSL